MDIKSLMVGDWVYNTYNRQNERVQEIGSGLVMLNYNDLYEFDEIEPIPLVPEILEKNGFEKQKQDIYEYFNDDENLNITFYPKSSNYTNGAYDYIDIEKGCLTINEMPIAFVHELQHALRLCGISKEIEL